MPFADQGLAVHAFSRLPLTAPNRKLAGYWLSLWNGGQLPMRAQFSPARMKDLLPGIGIFEVRPGVSSRCRLAGTAIQRALGREIAGKEWRAYTPSHQHGERLLRNSAIANGAVGIGVRHARSPDGKDFSTQELQLPFADETEDGARLILFHLDWRPVDSPSGPTSIAPVPVADEFHVMPLFAS